MGTSFTNYLVLDCPAQRVGDQITAWMAAKGFERSTDRPCFDDDAEQERGVYLIEMATHSTVLFSHEHSEGERLLFELRKLDRPVMKAWVYDSDIWGYDLFEDRELTAAFVSNPRYFGGAAELALPRNGDPELLCRVFRTPGREPDLARIQGQRAVFHETVLGRFCDALGVRSAGFDYDVLRSLGAAWDGPVEVQGCRIEWLFFRETGSGWEQRTTPLHEVELEAAPAQAPPGPLGIPQIPDAIPAGMRPLIFFSWLMSLVFRPLAWCLSLLFRGVFTLQRIPAVQRVLSRRLAASTDPLYEALQNSRSAEVRLEGEWLLNTLHRCRVRLPAGMSPAEGVGGATLFHLKDGERHLLWRAHRPDALSAFVNLPAGAEIIDDRRFIVAGMQVRTLRIRFEVQRHRFERWTSVIQTPTALYFLVVDGSDKQPLDDSLVERLAALVSSFERLD